jgi:alpha-tubulin suppressor-like RCC1 family protein
MSGNRVDRLASPRIRLQLSMLLAYSMGLWLTLLHHIEAHHTASHLPFLGQWLRDSTALLPAVIAAVWAGLAIARRLERALPSPSSDPGRAGLATATVTLTTSGALAALGPVQGWLLGSHGSELASAGHMARSLLVLIPVALMVSAAAVPVATLGGTPASTRVVPPVPARERARRAFAATAAGVLGLALLPATVLPANPALAQNQETPGQLGCGTLPGTRTITAQVVALDQEFDYNRLGATNPAGMIYALRRDVVVKSGPNQGTVLTRLPESAAQAGNVELREDKRPRPLVLRANVGDCLQIRFQNLLAPQRVHNNQPADRHVGVHVAGLQVVDAITSNGAFVGRGPSGLAEPGEFQTYKLFAEHENTYLLTNPGVSAGAEGFNGTIGFGLFGAVNVEPFGTTWHRSQLTRAELDLATASLTAAGHPVIDYQARYPSTGDPNQAGLPILNLLNGTELVHSELNAIIAGPASDNFRIPLQSYPQTYWDNQVYNLQQEKGREPFREFTTIFHDEIFARQAFDLFDDPRFNATLHSVRDGFAINYGTGGIGAEIIANRLGVGPMWDCADCKYEEFFLSSWTVGDPAMVVDIPANATDNNGNLITGPKATKALYPDDPSNVHRSYINDRVKFRNLHAGAEHHIFHLHAHQWQFMSNTKTSNYLDSQIIGSGSGYTYEIAFGGSGNRNKTPGDAIFHCHFYPHFAQGMWELWRNHDTFEPGTELDAEGRPVAGSRAQPDGEITAGTPIPAVVPLPSLVMAPMPDPDATVVPYDLDGDGNHDSSQVDADGNGTADTAEGFAVAPGTNPGFPLFIPGLAGHRPPTPPLDIVDTNGDGQLEDGGLPRHIITDGTFQSFETPRDFNKTLLTTAAQFLPEAGTAAEKVAMAFHERLWQPSYRTDGKPVNGTYPLTGPTGRPIKGFETNGLPRQPGAPYAEPCRTDPTPANGWRVEQTGRPRLYKGANLQIDAVINKLGWHFPQQRVITLWDDVAPTLSRARAPEPLVMRLNVNDCGTYQHANLVPHIYEFDDYQVRTPTDVMGQHIHLVKFDVTSSDGSGNGFNYEDGTFSPEEVVERVEAIRANNGCPDADPHLDPGDTWTLNCPLARAHPFFKNVAGLGDLVWGARTTAQRWYADPLPNGTWDQGLGSVFTHDHFGPSTHQQVGLYATVLVEPEGSLQRDPETGVIMGSRHDGGPTSWKADIIWPSYDPRNENAHREFYLEYADFQQAYEAGGGKLTTIDNGAGVMIPTYADFPNAINPSFRQEPPAGREKDLLFFPNQCPNGSPRPCAEAIAADDVGTQVVNYRNESIGLRVFNPAYQTQTVGDAGDLSRALESRTDRAIGALNVQPAFYPPLTRDVSPGDPFTPLLRTYQADKVRIRTQVGATEEQHNPTVQGVKWLNEPMNPNSGWRNSIAQGISEYAIFEVPVPDFGPGSPAEVDHLYAMGAQTEDLWNGTWGILRGYAKARNDLLRLPNNPIPATGWLITNNDQFDETCPLNAPVRTGKVTAVRAADVLGANGLVYNDRKTAVKRPDGSVQGAGPLVDPDALLYVWTDDVVWNSYGKPVGLKPGTPVEPIVMRANAGDCIKVELRNALPSTVPDRPGFNLLPPVIHKDHNVNGGIVTFNENDVRPSSLVGLHEQLLSVNARRNDGLSVGRTKGKVVLPGTKDLYTWYAGDVDLVQVSGGLKAVPRPVEFGAINISSSDQIEQAGKGLIGALIILPPGSTRTDDPDTRLSVRVTGPDTAFREHVVVLQDNLQLRYGSQCTPTTANLQCAVPDVGSEGGGAAEDAEDSGKKAINYGAEPMWFRLGIAPDTPAEQVRDNPDIHRLYANELIGGKDPQTAVFTAKPGEPVRVRLLQPGGHARGHVFNTHGHAWQRQPYLNNSDRLNFGPPPADPTVLNLEPNGISPGHNNISFWVGSQEGVSAQSHFDLLLPRAGGRFGVTGDYLFHDSAGLGNYQGLWGILRVAYGDVQQSARIDGGNWHTIWLAPDGRVAATGDNSYGQLGDGTTTDRTVSGWVNSLTDVVAVSAGRYHNLALDSDGQVWAWGRNIYGQLGDGTTTNRMVPVRVNNPAVTRMVAVSAGQFFSMALDSDGNVWAWGDNGSGQLGDGTTTNRMVPVQVDHTKLTGVVAIAAGLVHSLAIDSTGAAWAWGHNFSGQVGDGTRTDRLAPVRVVDTHLTGVVVIAGGAGQSLAIDSTGAAWAWGNNFEGQLGDGTNANSTVPVRVDDTHLTSVVAIAAGLGHTLAIDSDGKAWAWGRNAFGQLGNGSTTNSPVPVPVTMTGISHGVSDIGAGIEHSVAIEDLSDLGSWTPWAWGVGGLGQLGTGGTGSSAVPVPMVLPAEPQVAPPVSQDTVR